MDICYINRTIATLYELTAKTKMSSFTMEDGKEQSLVASAIADEGLYGFPLLVLEESGDFYKIRTHYSYEAYVLKSDVICKKGVTQQRVVTGRYVDVLNIPKVQGVSLMSLVQGSLTEVTDEVTNGYRRVVLLDGREGYVPDKYLAEKRFATDTFDASGTLGDEGQWKAWLKEHLNQYYEGSEEAFREAVTETAKGYAGTQYRWGGKSPLGIDCSGLTSISYMLNGVLTYRDARVVEGYPVKEIPRDQMKKGDLLYFKGHIAMYLGDGMYIHSTARAGSNGVDFNSFCPNDERYRKDLDEGLLKVGTIFW